MFNSHTPVIPQTRAALLSQIYPRSIFCFSSLIAARLQVTISFFGSFLYWAYALFNIESISAY